MRMYDPRSNLALSATVAHTGTSLQASAKEMALLDKLLSRQGVSLNAASGRAKSADALTAEIEKLDVPVTKRLELKIMVERVEQGLPI